jgi:hypothetical protein
MGAKRSDHIVAGETSRSRIGEHARGEGTQPTIALPRGVGLRKRGADERADSALRFDDADPLELRVDACDGVGIDSEINRELADGRQLVTGAQAAGGDRGAQPTLELGIDRGGVALVEGAGVQAPAASVSTSATAETRRHAEPVDESAMTDTHFQGCPDPTFRSYAMARLPLPAYLRAKGQKHAAASGVQAVSTATTPHENHPPGHRRRGTLLGPRLG